MDKFDLMWAIGCLGILFAVQMTGIPTFTLLGTASAVTLGVFGAGIIIYGLISAKQSTLSGAGLDWVGRAAKSGDVKDFDRKLGSGHAARLRNKLLNRGQFEWPARYEPQSYEDNRLLTFVQQDYALRLNIFLSKWYIIKNVIGGEYGKFAELNKELDRFGIPYTRSDLRREVKEFRSGTDSDAWAELYAWIDEVGPIKGTQKTYSPEELKLLIDAVRGGGVDINEITRANNLRDRVYKLLKKGQQVSGWTAFDRTIIAVINETTKKMIEAIKTVNDFDARIAAAQTDAEKERLEAEKEEKIRDKINEINILKSRIVSAAGRTSYQYGEFVRRLKPFGVHHEVRSYLLNLYDTYNPTGEYEHHYIVTKPGAKFRGNANVMDERGAEDASENIEVDLHGIDIDEKNKRDIEGAKISPRKLLNPRAMSHFIPNFLEFAAYLENAWDVFLRNFRFGEFASRSRTTSDYAKAFKAGIDVHSNDDAVPFSGTGDMKFDRRALANPGKIPYKGPKYYKNSGSEKDEKFPMLTQNGIIIFLDQLARAIEIDSERVLRDFATKLAKDKGTLPNTEQELIEAIENAAGSSSKGNKDANN